MAAEGNQTAMPSRMGCGWRGGFLLATAAVVGVPLGSLAAALVAPQEGWIGFVAVGFVGAGVAILFAGLNWAVALRYPIHLWRHGSREGFQYVSGVPVVGNLFGTVGATVGWGDWRVATLALLAVVVDYGGLPWFVGTMIRTRQF